MRCFLIFTLLVLATSAVCDQNRPNLVNSRPVGVIYLIQQLNQPSTIKDDLEITNAIPIDNPNEKEDNKFLLALAQSGGPKKSREKRSPWKSKQYGGGSGCGYCNRCSGGHYPYCGGSGGGSSGAWAKASSGAWGYGGGGSGK